MQIRLFLWCCFLWGACLGLPNKADAFSPKPPLLVASSNLSLGGNATADKTAEPSSKEAQPLDLIKTQGTVIKTEKKGFVKGVVIEGQQKTPLAQSRVSLRYNTPKKNSYRSQSLTSKVDGTFEFTLDGEGEMVLYAWHENYKLATLALGSNIQEKTLTLELDRGESANFSLLQRLPYQQLGILGQRKVQLKLFTNQRSYNFESKTDVEGNCLISGLQKGDELEFNLDGYCPQKVPVHLDHSTKEILFEVASKLEIQVLDDRQEPLKNASFWISKTDGGSESIKYKYEDLKKIYQLNQSPVGNFKLNIYCGKFEPTLLDVTTQSGNTSTYKVQMTPQKIFRVTLLNVIGKGPEKVTYGLQGQNMSAGSSMEKSKSELCQYESPLPKGSYETLTITAEGYAPEKIPFSIDQLNYTVPLSRGATIALTVTHEQSISLEGLDLRLEKLKDQYYHTVYRAVQLKTDKEGKVNIDGLVAGQYRVMVKDPKIGFGISDNVVLSGQEVKALTLSLKAGLKAELQVFDEKQEPLLGVNFYAKSMDSEFVANYDESSKTYRLHFLPEETFTLMVAKHKYEEASLELKALPDTIVQKSVTLKAKTAYTFMLLNLEGKAPSTINFITSRNNSSRHYSLSLDQGSQPCSYEWLVPQNEVKNDELQLNLQGYVPVKIPFLVTQSKYEVQLDRGLVLTAMVKDETGAVLEGVEVHYNGEGEGHSGSVRSSSEGKIEIKGLLACTYYINLRKSGYVEQAFKLNLKEDLGCPVWEMSRGGTLQIAVRDSAYKTPENLPVQLFITTDHGVSGLHQNPQPKTNSSGRVVFTGLEAGRYFAKVSDLAIGLGTSEELEVKNGETTEGHIVLKKGFTAEIQVLDEQQQPLKDVYFYMENGHQISFISSYDEAKKVYVLNNLEEGEFKLRVAKNAYVETKVNLKIQGEEIVRKTIELKAQKVISIVLKNLEEPMPTCLNVAFIYQGGSHGVYGELTKDSHPPRYDIFKPNEGVDCHTLTIKVEGYAVAKIPYKEEQTLYEVDLDSGLSLKARVQDEAGLAIDGVNVDGYNSGDSSSINAKSNSEGIIDLKGLAGIEYHFSLYKAGYTSKSFKFTVTPQTPSPTWILSKGGSLKVFVLGSLGMPVAGVQVSAEKVRVNGGVENIISNSDDVTNKEGYCLIGAIAEGRWRAKVNDKTQGYGSSEEVEVRNNESAEAQISLKNGLSLQGQVVDENGKGIPRVTLFSHKSMDSAQRGRSISWSSESKNVQSDIFGQFKFYNLKEGDYNLTLQHENYELVGASPIKIAAGSQDLKLEMTRCKILQVFVQTLDQSKAKKVTLHIKPESQQYMNQIYNIEEFEGVYRVKSNQLKNSGKDEKPFRIVAKAQGFNPGESELMTLASLPEKIEIRLNEERSMKFHFVNNQGEPVEGVRISAALKSPNQSLSYDHSNGSITDSTGNAVMKGLPEGDYQFTCQHKRYVTAYQNQRVTPNNPNPIEIVLQWGATLKGVVKNSQGQSLPYAQVSVNQEATMSHTYLGASSDAQGHYQISSISAGEYKVKVSYRVDVKKTQTPITVNFREGEEIVLDLVVPDSKI